MTRFRLLVLFSSAVMACGGDPMQDVAPGDGEDCQGCPAAPGESFSVRLDIEVPPGTEDTRCVEKRLGNQGARWIGAVHTELIGVSHHLIVYRSAAGAERPEPFPCDPFLDTLRDTTTPLMISQIAEETLRMPDRVALRIDDQQMIRLEMHYINASDTPAAVSAEARFEVMPNEQFEAEADFLFVGNPDIELPPGPSTLGPTTLALPPELADINVFAVTGHTHQWGTAVTIEQLASTAAAAGTTIYDHEGWNWEEPEVQRYDPPLSMPAGAGFRFTCEWDNRSEPPQTVGFGESANDEMCFFWAYYYPSRGHKICIHSEQLGRPIDLCCPDDALCQVIDDYLAQSRTPAEP
jgi:hypothetical protein